MERDDKAGGVRRTGIASQALAPEEPPMCALRSGEHWLPAFFERGRWDTRRDQDRFAANHVEPVPPNATAWPITPQNRERSGRKRLGRTENGYGGNRHRGHLRPEDSTHSPGFQRGGAFLTLRTQITASTVANAGRVEQAVRAIALWPAFLRIQQALSRTHECAICLRKKG